MVVEVHEEQGVRLAIEGCGHGTLHAIYASVEEACKRQNWPGVDLLIIGGDFQAVRNAYDLNCVSMPAKYRAMGDFHEYYSGQRQAPYLTLFVGGNHEASNYLFELYYGGWVAPHIYYAGAANVLRFGLLRIAALSGIWKGYNYRKPHHERLPYNESDLKSIYHVRELDVRKLLQIRTPIDIGISHDWPKGVEWKGNHRQLFRLKKHLEDDAKAGQLGSVAAQQVMEHLRPTFWFSAHLHCKYSAVVQHGPGGVMGQPPPKGTNFNGQPNHSRDVGLEPGDLADGPDQEVRNEDEIDLDMDDEVNSKTSVRAIFNEQEPLNNADEIDLELDEDGDGTAHATSGFDGSAAPLANDAANKTNDVATDQARAALPAAFKRPPAPESREHPPEIANKTTRFLALDKCLPNHHFLQLMSVPGSKSSGTHDRPFKLCYDLEWLAITRTFALDEPLVLGDPDARPAAPKSQADYKARISETQRLFRQDGTPDMRVPDNFEATAPVYDGGNWNLPQYSSVQEYPNPQTAWFCRNIGITNPFEISAEEIAERSAAGPRLDPENARFASGGRGRGGAGRGRPESSGSGRGRSRGRGRGR